MSSGFEQRLGMLEASSAIRALKMRYARTCDDGYRPEVMRSLFTEDAVWDGGETFGRYEGREAIVEFFSGTPERVAWAMHYTVAGDIDVAADLKTATATWYLWQPMTLDGNALWLIADYADEYVKTPDGWKFSDVKCNVQALTPIDVGWVKTRIVS